MYPNNTGVTITNLPGAYNNPAPSPAQRSARFTYLVVPLLILLLIGSTIYWLQWAAQHTISLQYPQPYVQINGLPSAPISAGTTLQLSATSPGKDLTYSWDLGDGSYASSPNVSHTYQAGGQYHISITVTDGIHQTSAATETLTVQYVPLNASFTYSVGYYGQVSFDASSSSTDPSLQITQYYWDFGDGYTDTTQNSQDSHGYAYTGGNPTYNVRLTVTDSSGRSTSTVQQVTVGY